MPRGRRARATRRGAVGAGERSVCQRAAHLGARMAASDIMANLHCACAPTHGNRRRIARTSTSAAGTCWPRLLDFAWLILLFLSRERFRPPRQAGEACRRVRR